MWTMAAPERHINTAGDTAQGLAPRAQKVRDGRASVEMAFQARTKSRSGVHVHRLPPAKHTKAMDVGRRDTRSQAARWAGAGPC